MMLMKSFSSPRSSILLTHSSEFGQQPSIGRSSIRSPHSGSRRRSRQPPRHPPTPEVLSCSPASPWLEVSNIPSEETRAGSSTMRMEGNHSSAAHNENDDRVVMRKSKLSSVSAKEMPTATREHRSVRSRVKSELSTSTAEEAQKKLRTSSASAFDRGLKSGHKRSDTKSEPVVLATAERPDSSYCSTSQQIRQHNPRGAVTPSVFHEPVGYIRFISTVDEGPFYESVAVSSDSRMPFSTSPEWSNRHSRQSTHLRDAQTQTSSLMQDGSIQTLKAHSIASNAHEATNTTTSNTLHDTVERATEQQANVRKPALKFSSRASTKHPLHVQISISTDEYSSQKSMSPVSPMSPTQFHHEFINKKPISYTNENRNSILSGSSSSVCSEAFPSAPSTPSPTIRISPATCIFHRVPNPLLDTRVDTVTLTEASTLLLSSEAPIQETATSAQEVTPAPEDLIILRPVSSGGIDLDTSELGPATRQASTPPADYSSTSKRLTTVLESSDEVDDDDNDAGRMDALQLAGKRFRLYAIISNYRTLINRE